MVCLASITAGIQRKKLAKLGSVYGKIKQERKLKYHNTSIEGVIELQKTGEYPLLFVFKSPGVKIPVELVKSKRVLILDLDVGMETMTMLLEHCTSIMHIDHHKSGEECVKLGSQYEKYNYVFKTADIHSGASLSWEFFNQIEEMPNVVSWVQIGDTWTWQRGKNECVQSILSSLHYRNSFDLFDTLESVYMNAKNDIFVKELETEGKIINDYRNKLSMQIANWSTVTYVNVKNSDDTFTEMACLLVNAGTLNSEVGTAMNVIAETHRKNGVDIKFCAVWSYSPNMINVSLRSPADGIDLSYIAANIQNATRGGGHVKAAGFVINGIENLHQVFSVGNSRLPVNCPP
jgi:oligoribonuclease NrnB/cAMP/cGMP phosphodiesterase (DHH superfamily)